MPNTRTLVTTSVNVVIKHANGTVTDLGDMSGWPTLRQRYLLWRLRRKQRKEN